MEIALSVNGREVVRDVPPQELLLDLLRDTLALTGAKRSCDVQVCGACTVLVNGLPVSSCCFLAADAGGTEVTTIEGLAEHPLVDAFVRADALQCGFCTPGQIVSAAALVKAKPEPSRDEIRHAMAGNLCRCGTYPKIEEAIRAVVGQLPEQLRRSSSPVGPSVTTAKPDA